MHQLREGHEEEPLRCDGRRHRVRPLGVLSPARKDMEVKKKVSGLSENRNRAKVAGAMEVCAHKCVHISVCADTCVCAHMCVCVYVCVHV